MFGRAKKHERSLRDEQGTEQNPWDTLNEVKFAGGGLTEKTDVAGPIWTEPAPELQPLDESEQEKRAEEGRQTLAAFVDFFQTDMRVKDAIVDAAPSSADFYDQDSRMRYLDRASRGFSDFEPDFQKLAREFRLGEDVEQQTSAFFERGSEAFATSNLDNDNLNRIYQNQFYQLRDNFIDETQDNAVGYMLDRDLGKLVGHAESVNELLHAYHSSIMNNEAILQKIPELESHDNIVLRGEKGGLGEAVYTAIPENFDAGETDIISIDDKMLMMVRDRAHALMIEAEPLKERPGEIIVHYNLPKIINREMVAALPGIGRIGKSGASGRFAVPEAELGEQLVDFIEHVPTDEDNPLVQRLYQEALGESQ